MKDHHALQCGASMSAGRPCARRPASGKTRCHYHGGAPGSGAPPDNSNALKHGFYSDRLRHLGTDLLAAAEQPLDLSGEIAVLRVVLARAVESAQPQVIAVIVSTLARLIKAQQLLAEAVATPVPDNMISLEVLVRAMESEEIVRDVEEEGEDSRQDVSGDEAGQPRFQP